MGHFPAAPPPGSLPTTCLPLFCWYLKSFLLQLPVQHPTGARDGGQSHTYIHTHIYICTGVFLLKMCSLSLGEGKEDSY